MKKIFERMMRSRTRVYIFPTRMGGYAIGLISLMFLLSIGYSNNLLLIFTITLFGLNLLWVVNSHFHLARLSPGQVFVEDGHMKTPIAATFRWKKWPRGNLDWTMTLIGEKDRTDVKILGEEEGRTIGEVTLPSRGLYHWTHLLVKTDRPFGLYRTWIYFKIDVSAHAYPTLMKEMPLPSPEILEREGTITGEKKGDDGLRGLAHYQGEGSKRISWKHYAKSGDLLVKEGEELKTNLMRIRLQLPDDKKMREAHLSKLATLMVYCYRQEIPFVFMGEKEKGPGAHLELLKDCLRELSLC
ncbi:MAG: DUF58 domain-containing protein [Bdellovibrionota bacterium]